MRKFRVPDSREQVSLLPPAVDDYVPAEDVVRYVDALVDEFDLTAIEAAYSYGGRPAYSPKILVKILVYGKMRGIRSSRQLAQACCENLRFIFLAQNERPDFRTIIIFRKRFLKELGNLLTQTVRIGIQEGIVDLKHVAIDGTKVRANASANSFRSTEKLEERLEMLKASLEDDIRRDDSEDNEYGNDDCNPKLPKTLQGKRALVERLKQALKNQDEDERTTRSSSDPDATFMKGPEGKRPSYNAQAAVDAKSRMVVAASVTAAGSDHGQLKPMLECIEKETGRNPEQASADKGYRETAGLVELEERNIEGFVPLQESCKKRYGQEDFLYDEEEDEYICPQGRTLVFVQERLDHEADIYIAKDCSGCCDRKLCLRDGIKKRTLKVSHHADAVHRARARMATQEAKEMMKLRAKTVELVFGWLKTHRLLRRFMFRGLNWVHQEWRFECAAVNVQRLVAMRRAAGT